MVHKGRVVLSLIAVVVLGMLSVFNAVRSESGPSIDAAVDASSKSKAQKPATLVAGNLTWQLNIDQAYKLAKKSRKLVLVDVYTDWCGWCKKLDKDTYSKPAVIDYLNKQFICLKIDAEDGGPGQVWSKQHNVEAFPCIAVVDDTGNLRGMFYGYRTAAEFPTEIDKILSPVDNTADATPSQP